LLRVEAGPGTVAREPVEPLVTRVDRPHERLVEGVKLALPRMEDPDRRVLAQVPELPHGKPRRSAAGSGQKRSAAACSRASHPYSSCSQSSVGSQSGGASTMNASTWTLSYRNGLS